MAGDKSEIIESSYPSIANWCRNRVNAKRKRKGLGEFKKRESNVYLQFYQYSTSVVAAKVLFTPLDRVRLLQ